MPNVSQTGPSPQAVTSFHAARRLHELHQQIRRWVEFYHKDDREFLQMYQYVSNALTLGEADLEYRINPKLARRAWEQE